MAVPPSCARATAEVVFAIPDQRLRLDAFLAFRFEAQV
jgi:hypothetical protein